MENDGWCSIYTNSNSHASVQVNGITVATLLTKLDNIGIAQPPFPVKSGDVVFFNISAGSGSLYFYPNR